MRIMQECGTPEEHTIKEIAVVNKITREVYAHINFKDGNMIEYDNLEILINKSDREHIFQDVDGIVYLKR